MAKPSIPQGTRDFSADVIRKRNFILGHIRSIFAGIFVRFLNCTVFNRWKRLPWKT